MFLRSLTLSSLWCCLGFLPAMAQATTLSTADERASWVAEAGDEILVDTERSIVYLVHPDGTSLALDGLTGQRRTVRYIGRTYFAATPEDTWVIQSVEEKGRSSTFGEGRFLRLFTVEEDGLERTAYGFHSHRSMEQMLQDKAEKNDWDPTGQGHRSYGCVLLREEDLDLVVATLQANAGSLTVRTGVGLEPPSVFLLDQPPSWVTLP
jgi:hypothetical protein